MPYRIAGIDVHKKMLAVVVADVECEGEYEFERRRFGSNPEQLQLLSEWLIEQQVEEAVMESTAQYWQPVWGALERYWRPICQTREGAGAMSGKLHLAQAQSNRGRRGRKKDFPDAERLVKRLVAQELVLSFVPDPEQRLWRTVTRRKLHKFAMRIGPGADLDEVEHLFILKHGGRVRVEPRVVNLRPGFLKPIRIHVAQSHQPRFGDLRPRFDMKSRHIPTADQGPLKRRRGASHDGLLSSRCREIAAMIEAWRPRPAALTCH